MGGYLSACYALQHPERVQHLILMVRLGWFLWCQGMPRWLSGAAWTGLVILRPCRWPCLNFGLLRVLQCPAGVGRKPADWQVPAVLRDPWTWRGMLFRCAP